MSSFLIAGLAETDKSGSRLRFSVKDVSLALPLPGRLKRCDRLSEHWVESAVERLP